LQQQWNNSQTSILWNRQLSLVNHHINILLTTMTPTNR
jgi:hypothetical protein